MAFLLGRVSIQSADDSRQNAQFLSGIVSHDADLDTHLCKVWAELQGCDGHVLDGLGVEAQNAKVVHRVAIDGVDVALSWSQLGSGRTGGAASYLFVIVKDAVADKRASADDVLGHMLALCLPTREHGSTYPVGEDVALFSVDDKARGLGRDGGVRVKGARLAKVDRHDALDHALYRLLPLCRVVHGADNVGGSGDIELPKAVVATDVVHVLPGLGRRGNTHAVCGNDDVHLRLLLDVLYGAVLGRRGWLLALARNAMVFHGRRGRCRRRRRAVEAMAESGSARRACALCVPCDAAEPEHWRRPGRAERSFAGGECVPAKQHARARLSLFV